MVERQRKLLLIVLQDCPDSTFKKSLRKKTLDKRKNTMIDSPKMLSLYACKLELAIIILRLRSQSSPSYRDLHQKLHLDLPLLRISL
ncbi:hypothetical protein H5410_013169 [Solanum commersonii]|uniref:Uncharacterized protein n=1 Tax=Solanum commersonii TaxID=4109 RepID=A0A9J6AT68_SOLCO|nr:hypothetical protein H5410_012983 [Solanum commersonii]KAG5627951.1 hypothetical protein H5410_013169 [Solanum commersonii]